MGWLTACGGLAMVTASLLMARIGLPARRVMFMTLALFVNGAALVVGSLRPNYWLLLAGVTVALSAVPALNATTSTMFHESVPEYLRGRVMGLRSAIARTLQPVGSIVAGVVTSEVARAISDDGILAGSVGRVIGTGPEQGPALMMTMIGLAMIVVAARLATLRRVRELEASHDQPVAATLVA
jgi:MFS family permease